MKNQEWKFYRLESTNNPVLQFEGCLVAEVDHACGRSALFQSKSGRYVACVIPSGRGGYEDPLTYFGNSPEGIAKRLTHSSLRLPEKCRVLIRTLLEKAGPEFEYALSV